MLKRKPATVNNALAAVDGLHIRRGLGPANAARAELPRTAPKALKHARRGAVPAEVQRRPSPRDRVIALVPFYAGARIAEITGLDVDDVRLSARKGVLRILGHGEKVREIPIHPQLRVTLTGWLDEHPDWPGAGTPALFLNQRGGRLSVKRMRTRAGHDAAFDRQAHAEGSISELKRHGAGRARCRGTRLLQLQLLAAATAINLKRLINIDPAASQDLTGDPDARNHTIHTFADLLAVTLTEIHEILSDERSRAPRYRDLPCSGGRSSTPRPAATDQSRLVGVAFGHTRAREMGDDRGVAR